MFDLHIIAVLSFIGLATLVTADHTITLNNKCSKGVPVWVDSHPGKVAYTGAQPGTIAAHTSKNVVVHKGWNSRICGNADGAKCADGVTKESMVEFNMDVGSPALDYYDISNIRGFSFAQQVHPHNTSPFGGCQTTTCTNAKCPCDQAYPLNNEQGCGPGIDSPVKACPSGDFTITYCP